MFWITKTFITNAFGLSIRGGCRSICTESEVVFAVKVRSKSFIKPSTKTPPKFRDFKLSLLDQLLPSPLYPTFVLFYPINNTTPWLLLRDSLSKTLSHFYPFSGRIKEDDHHVVDCSDQGAVYLEAVANQEMSHFLSSSPAPNIQLLRQLAPPRPKMMSVHNMPLACFQMTAFRCGGLAVGISLNHLIADGHTFSLFLNHWAAVYKGDYNHGRLNKLTNAEDMASSLFPINDTILKSKPLSWCKQEKDLMHPDIVLRRFVFKSDKISALKSRVESSEVPNPSRAIAIFGLIWKTAMNAYKTSSLIHPGKTTMSMSSALLVVNLRPRLINTTPLTYYSIGNLHWGVVSSYDHSTKMLSTTDELKGLVARLKKSVEEVDAEFVESLKGENGHEKINKWLEGRGKGKEYVFTSVIKMGLNEIDFGWGEPIWVGFLGLTDVPSPDGVCLIDGTTTTNCGGVEAWVSLAKEEMDSFEQDHDLLKYATVNPIVLINSL